MTMYLPNLSKIEKNIEKTLFRDLQGNNNLTKFEKCSAMWSFEGLDGIGSSLDKEIEKAFDKEIEKALLQECYAEVTQNFLLKARSVARVIAIFDEWEDLNNIYDKVASRRIATLIDEGFNAALEYGARWAVISPVHLTIITANLPEEEKEYFPIKRDKDEPFGNLPFVGRYKYLDIFVDQYASDNAPILIGKPRGFLVKGSGFSIDRVVIDPNTLEPVLRFRKSYEFEILPDKFYAIDIDMKSSGCFL